MSRRIPLPLAAPIAVTPCTECARCCTYVSVEIDPPRSLRAASDILWFLYHDRVSVHRDGDGEWSVVFQTRCRHLQPDRRCGVYAERPLICREFDDRTCEVNAPAGALEFDGPEPFLEWLRAQRPALSRRLAAGLVPPLSRPDEAAS